jgi:hypothetical protein
MRNDPSQATVNRLAEQRRQLRWMIWLLGTGMVLVIALGYLLLAPMLVGPSEQGRLADQTGAPPNTASQPGHK